jgi:hypothetical protein
VQHDVDVHLGQVPADSSRQAVYQSYPRGMRSKPIPSSGRKNLIRWSQPLSAKACRSSPVKVNRRKLGVRSSIRATRTSKSRNGVLTASAAIVMRPRYSAGKPYLTPV